LRVEIRRPPSRRPSRSTTAPTASTRSSGCGTATSTCGASACSATWDPVAHQQRDLAAHGAAGLRRGRDAHANAVDARGGGRVLVPSRQVRGASTRCRSPPAVQQLLMVGGTDRYYQIAPVLRDEDCGPIASTVHAADAEASFVTRRGARVHSEAVLDAAEACSGSAGRDRRADVAPGDGALRHGQAGPALGMELVEATAVFAATEFKASRRRAIRLCGLVAARPTSGATASTPSRTVPSRSGQGPRLDAGRRGRALRQPGRQFLSADEQAALVATTRGETGDLLLRGDDGTRLARCWARCATTSAAHPSTRAYRYLWVHRLPRCSRPGDTPESPEPAHHPCATRPHAEDVDRLESDVDVGGGACATTLWCSRLGARSVRSGSRAGPPAAHLDLSGSTRTRRSGASASPTPFRRRPAHGGFAFGVTASVPSWRRENIREVIRLPKPHRRDHDPADAVDEKPRRPRPPPSPQALNPFCMTTVRPSHEMHHRTEWITRQRALTRNDVVMGEAGMSNETTSSFLASRSTWKASRCLCPRTVGSIAIRSFGMQRPTCDEPPVVPTSCWKVISGQSEASDDSQQPERACCPRLLLAVGLIEHGWHNPGAVSTSSCQLLADEHTARIGTSLVAIARPRTRSTDHQGSTRPRSTIVRIGEVSGSPSATMHVASERSRIDDYAGLEAGPGAGTGH